MFTMDTEAVDELETHAEPVGSKKQKTPASEETFSLCQTVALRSDVDDTPVELDLNIAPQGTRLEILNVVG